jgi:DNA-cytosine methyltransferase
MKVLSLFDGISCGQIALHKNNIKIENYYASEIDKNAIKVTQCNFPSTIQLGDITQIDFDNYKHIDLLIGGSPCQSLSIIQSKTREGLDGKSKLFYEFIRALKTINPKWWLFENVASMNTESKNTMSDLFGCKPILIDSADFSAQTRQRLYWTNIPYKVPETKNNLLLKDILENNVDEKYYYTCGYDFLGWDKNICATLNINGHDIIKRVQNPNSKCNTLTACNGGNHQKKVLINNRVRKLTPIEYERLQCLPDNYTSCVADTHRYTSIGNGWTVDVICQLLKCLE